MSPGRLGLDPLELDPLDPLDPLEPLPGARACEGEIRVRGLGVPTKFVVADIPANRGIEGIKEM
jgi:hypothetical protein